MYMVVVARTGVVFFTTNHGIIYHLDMVIVARTSVAFQMSHSVVPFANVTSCCFCYSMMYHYTYVTYVCNIYNNKNIIFTLCCYLIKINWPKRIQIFIISSQKNV